MLREALDRHGATPIIIRSGGGNHQCWYRHNGERRAIRPFADTPVDVLGGGYVVAPPSTGSKAKYAFLQGSLDDLGNLPIMRGLEAEHVRSIAVKPPFSAAEHVSQGGRNNALFRFCMREARYCDDLDSLLDCARTWNDGFLPPLEDEEIFRVARSAWGYEERGENRFGKPGAFVPVLEANHLSTNDQDLLILLVFLRANNGPNRIFMIADALHDRLGWTRKRLASARRRLLGTYVEVVRRPSMRNGAGLYRWLAKTGQN